jgi:hypothetical protein
VDTFRCYILSLIIFPFSLPDKQNIQYTLYTPLKPLFEGNFIRCVLAQDDTMLLYNVIFVLLPLVTVMASGQCPARCRCPSIIVANCVSADLIEIPTDRYVLETLL